MFSESMNTNEWPRAVTTAAIWISISLCLGFGLFRMNFSGPGIILLLILTVLLILGAVIATAIVWRAKPAHDEKTTRLS